MQIPGLWVPRFFTRKSCHKIIPWGIEKQTTHSILLTMWKRVQHKASVFGQKAAISHAPAHWPSSKLSWPWAPKWMWFQKDSKRSIQRSNWHFNSSAKRLHLTQFMSGYLATDSWSPIHVQAPVLALTDLWVTGAPRWW